MKRALVTGAFGFIGRHALASLAARGFEVHAVDRRAPPGERLPPAVTPHQLDLLTQMDAVAQLIDRVRPSHLLHLAWVTTPGDYWTSAENLRWVGASLELAERFASCGGHRVVVAGSCAEYDWSHGACIESVTPRAPATLYGRSKHALHLILQGYAPQAKLSLAWPRFFQLYGPGEHPSRLVPTVVRALLRDEPARVTHGQQVRDFLHVADAADAAVILLDSTVEGPVNIASGEGTAVAEVVRSIARNLARESLVRWGALPVPASDPPVLVADVRRLRDEVGWSGRYDRERGIADAVNYWRARLHP